jgi:hypothetical protein
MENCKHKVGFKESRRDKPNRAGESHEWHLNSACFVCGRDLTNTEVKKALLQIYTHEIADLIFIAFEHRKNYLQISSTLSSNGISINFLPEKI